MSKQVKCDAEKQWLAQVDNSRWPEYVRVLACLQLHSTLFGREECYTAAGMRLRSRDIAELTGLAPSNVRRALERLESVGFCGRLPTDESNPTLRKNSVLIMCYSNPRKRLNWMLTEARLRGASDGPTD